MVLVTGGGGSIGSELVRKIAEHRPKQLIVFELYENNAYDIQQEMKKKHPELTGGGGSIGSELVRKIAEHRPKQLIVFELYENNAYDIQQEMKKKHPELNLEVIIGSVRDSRKIFQVFEKYKPNVVYHAAAHKHVPLMEDSPCEAIKNNAIGTYKTAFAAMAQVFEKYKPNVVYHAAAHKHVPLMEDSPCEAIKNNAIGTYKTAFAAMANRTERFVLISTDKAVNPTNIMGASKRLCEMIIQAFDAKIKEGRATEIPQLFTHWMQGVYGSEEVNQRIRNAKTEFVAVRFGNVLGSNGSVIPLFKKQIAEGGPVVYGSEEVNQRIRNAKTEFVAVRFGNVLGSNGSVIPLFKKQIAEGGPVTVTHPDIIRYFMTIPEAVNLVLQAGTYAKGGEIFVLDMGSPVKIDTLARNHPDIIRYFMTIPEAVNLVLQAGTYAKGGEIFVLDMGSPVKIDTLARNLIKLSGFKPDVDIKIEYTGLRPGEKLFEEKLMSEEGMKKTPNELIHIGSPIPFAREKSFLKKS